MISSIFGKTKPINFILLAIYVSLYFIITQYQAFHKEDFFLNLILNSWMLAVLIFTVFLVDFIAKKNNLSKNNAYITLLFVLFLSAFPELFVVKNAILAHIFVLLSVRKLLSLKTPSLVKQKIFDASFWICIAALFYSWAILYSILIYAAIVRYTAKNYKNWLIPFIAAAAVLILRYTYFLWFEQPTDFFKIIPFEIPQHPITYSYTHDVLSLIFLVLISSLAMISHRIYTRKKRTQQQSVFSLMLIAWLLGINATLFLGDEEKTTLIFMLFPTSVMVAQYLERIKKKWVKETFFWIFLLIPMVFLALRFTSVS
jgi:Family of unknown function (DUF6427)